jgi:two-component system sensor histidine kinase DesK
MISPDGAAADDVAGRGALRLRRSITATWWYTASGVVFLEFTLVSIWAVALLGAQYGAGVVGWFAGGGLIWLASTVALLIDYRRSEGANLSVRPIVSVPLLVALAFGVVLALATGMWVLALFPVAQSLVLLRWPPGVRLRLVLGFTVLIAALWVVDWNASWASIGEWSGRTGRWLVAFYSTTLPVLSVMTLWWWDVLVTLDRARASEARLAATQERLRVATDVHDLQGHHLQVIALQLELAERLMDRDADAALEHLRASRASVDAARQGTRDLALRFRSVPLPDELANAVDLLRAAGIAAESTVDVDAERAPADVFGPVIRETTTNVLRHGGGSWARLSLTREGARWRYRISNDAPGDSETDAAGAGLDGLARRAGEAGGELEVHHDKGAFSVSISVPVALTVPR